MKAPQKNIGSADWGLEISSFFFIPDSPLPTPHSRFPTPLILRLILLREFGDDGVVRVYGVGDARHADLRNNLKGFPFFESVIVHQPVYQFYLRDAEGVHQWTDAASRHQVFAVFDARPANPPALDQVELKRHVHARFQPRPADFAVALKRVPVAEIEQRAIMKDRQIYGRALADVGSVHVAAEIARPESGPGFFALRRDGHAPEHRLQLDLDAFHPAAGKIEYADVALTVEFPDEAFGRDGVVEHRRAAVVGERAEAWRMGRNGRVAIRAQLQDLYDERVVGGRAFDIKRPDLAGPRAARPLVPVAPQRIGFDYVARLDAQNRLALGEGRIADLRRETMRFRRHAKSRQRHQDQRQRNRVASAQSKFQAHAFSLRTNYEETIIERR